MTEPINALEIKCESDNPFPEIFHNKMGASIFRGLSDHFQLNSFGVNMEVVQPGGSSGLKHWHTESEEFVFVLSGNLVLHYGEETFQLSSGDCIGFKAAEGIGHRLVNKTDREASFLVVGSRPDGDKAVYDEDDFQWVVKDNGDWVASRKTGEPY
ncbi:cupin domain-containing protein [Reinekea sp. G2M2-21]|uniref:cupin domain-containing protein n=1 Tax=Reinekea sp. G2M2-21 TaxID=2788942 RepID=UPI0018AA746C|nr:cupin domain-containing protein [Reinekea sp. G2M2-21]